MLRVALCVMAASVCSVLPAAATSDISEPDVQVAAHEYVQRHIDRTQNAGIAEIKVSLADLVKSVDRNAREHRRKIDESFDRFDAKIDAKIEAKFQHYESRADARAEALRDDFSTLFYWIIGTVIALMLVIIGSLYPLVQNTAKHRRIGSGANIF
ncbi:MAG: hypothetical protein ISN29_05175 [Gammaproteobacteria bacterium AqS3]|nr:hypothetical protein [Gammaproteobacteria bacterium AqS3]